MAWMLFASVDEETELFRSTEVYKNVWDAAIMCASVSLFGGLFCACHYCWQFCYFLCHWVNDSDFDDHHNLYPWCTISNEYLDSDGPNWDWNDTRCYVGGFGCCGAMINIPVFIGAGIVLMWGDNAPIGKGNNTTMVYSATNVSYNTTTKQSELMDQCNNIQNLAWMALIGSGLAICCGFTGIVRGICCCKGKRTLEGDDWNCWIRLNPLTWACTLV